MTPTVIRLTVLGMHDALIASIKQFETSLRNKAKQFEAVVIPGRTHMQDAVPITFGQVFGAYANAIEDACDTIERARDKFLEIGLGASAVGTGLNTHPRYRKLVVKHLATITGFSLRQAKDYFQATSSFGLVFNLLRWPRAIAIELEKIAHDLKLYSSGPKTMIAELKLPDLQAGSSIMPGKVNPVMPELMDQISYAVQGNDHTIALCAQNGQLQLNVMMPMMLIKITDAMRLITNSFPIFATQCLDGLEVNQTMVTQRMEYSTILLTALNPHIGYVKAAEVAKRVVKEGKTVREVVLEEKLTDHAGQLLTEEKLNAILSVEAMTHYPNLD